MIITRDIRVSLRNRSIFMSYFPPIQHWKRVKTKSNLDGNPIKPSTIPFKDLLKEVLPFLYREWGLRTRPPYQSPPPLTPPPPILPPAACHSLAINTTGSQVTRLFLPRAKHSLFVLHELHSVLFFV